MNDNLNLSQTSEILGVSDATIKNWVRHNFLTPINNNNSFIFNYNEVTSLKEKISNGNLERLNSRANKRNSTRKFIPKEYVEESISNDILLDVVDYITMNKLEIEEAIYLLSLNLLIKEKLIFNENLNELLAFKYSDFKNIFLLNIMKEYFIQIKSFTYEDKYQNMLHFEIPVQSDTLGLIYQSIKKEGDKAKHGSYYTPRKIVDDIVEEYIDGKSKILDPCCGTGQFLLNVSKKVEEPDKIYGFDIDPIAVFISKINLTIQYKKIDFNPNIFLRDTLLEVENSTLFSKNDLPFYYNFIITNPPWGLHLTNGALSNLKSLYPQIKSFESFSYFLLKSIEMLDENGILSFILPESILNIKVHKDIRNIILQHTSILQIVKLGRAFTNVFTKVIRIDLKKTSHSKSHKIKILSNKVYQIEQNRFWSNPDLIFDVDVTDFDERIIDKVFQMKYSTLKNNSEWALGIVTGDNNKFIHSVKQPGYEEIYKGKDIDKYFLTETNSFIKFEPEKFQQIAPVEKYRVKEKLIYRFISNKLVFAYDDKQKLTLNSANILIPKIKNYPTKVVLALLNSSLFQFIYLKKFSTIKVLRGNLEELPFPKFSNVEINKIVALVDNHLSYKTTIQEIDEFILTLFKITEAEKKYILETI